MQRALLAAGTLLLALSFGNVVSAETTVPDTPKGTLQADSLKGQKCISAQDWASMVAHKSTGVEIGVLADIDGMEAREVVARVNAEPPRTQMTADHLIVLGAKALATGEPQPYVLVAFFNQGCLVASGRADPDGIANLIEGESI
jgi:hypothetical protein